MLGTLSLQPVAGISTRFSTENRSLFAGKFRSDQKMYSVARKSVICAAVAEAAPEVERRRKQSKSLYEVLRVKRDASVKEIKTAYRTLAKMYHPDASAASAAAMEAAFDGKEFIEIHEAYATLSDPAARERYDLSLSLNSRGRRRPMRYRSADVRAPDGFYSTRRWETDQCW